MYFLERARPFKKLKFNKLKFLKKPLFLLRNFIFIVFKTYKIKYIRLVNNSKMFLYMVYLNIKNL